MASGITRSPYIVPIAKSLKWKPQRLREVLNEEGLFAPYMDEDAILKILDRRGISTAKYRAKGVRKNKAHRSPTMERIRAKKSAAAARKKLIPRLARLLPEGDSTYGMQKVRHMLVAGGYPKPLKGTWTDQARALRIFQDAGIPIEGFEYAEEDAAPPSPALRNLPALVEAPGTDLVIAAPVDLTTQAEGSLRLKVQRLETQQLEMYGQLQDRNQQLKLVRDILLSYETRLIKALKSGALSAITDPLEIPISALNELRARK